eukprot:XP_017952158.1 PREDICTED: cyclin-O protein B-like [Xenopus tropicalis]
METSKERKRRRRSNGEEHISDAPECSHDPKRVKHQGDRRGTRRPSAGKPAPRNEPWYTLAHMGNALQTFKEYGKDSYLYSRGLEEKFMAVNFLQHQPEITSASWYEFTSRLICIHRHLRLDFRSLCLTANLLERFLACADPIKTTDLNRVGATCFNIACKLAEKRNQRRPKHQKLFDDTLTLKEMSRLERNIIRKLKFRLEAPTMDYFMEHFTLLRVASQKDSPKAAIALTAARGIAALSLTHHQDFYTYAPSVMALCCLKVADKFHPSGKAVKVDPADYPDHLIEECVKKIITLISSKPGYLHGLLPEVFPKTLPALTGDNRTRPVSHGVETSPRRSRTSQQETDASASQQQPEGGEPAASRQATASNHLETAQGSGDSSYHQGVIYNPSYPYWPAYMHPHIPTYPYMHPYMHPYMQPYMAPHMQPYMHPHIPTYPYMHPYMATHPYMQPYMYPYMQPYMHNTDLHAPSTDTHTLTDSHT